MNEVLNNIWTRHSTRSYTDRQISEENLMTLVEAARRAPSGMHMEEWHFTAIQNAEVLKQLNDLVKLAFANSPLPQRRERAKSDTYCCYYHAPSMIVVAGRADSDLTPFDCACALENIFLAAHSLGISSCWINQPGQACDDERMKEFMISTLGIPEGYRIFGCAALGYAPEGTPVKEKKPKEGTVTVIKTLKKEG